MTCLRGQLFEGEDTKNCSSCYPREHINDLNSKLHSFDEFGSLIFIVDEREEQQMFFRYLAEMLMPNVSSRSTFFYGLSLYYENLYVYYKWEDQCLNDGCQMADLFLKKHSTKVHFSPYPAYPKLIAETYRHFRNNYELNCPQLSKNRTLVSIL
jgi:hypothetical protein